jgi:hypothetical protein
VQVEGVLNGIVSMLALVTGDKRESLILSFCEKLSKAPNNQLGLVCLKVLKPLTFFRKGTVTKCEELYLQAFWYVGA